MTTATKKRQPTKPATVTDKAQERHAKPGAICGASRNASGTLLVCTLPLHHPGGHEDDAGRTWRRSSGDEEAA